jgi:2-hydroxychromene-2-carboxylate isomerase
VCETILRHVWRGGAEASDGARLDALAALLKPGRDPQDPTVKAQLKSHTDEAIALGLFGVPTFVVDGKLFWGFDALPMLAAYLAGDGWFEAAWPSVGEIAVGVRR